MTVKVAINGYGTIGKRVADAVSLQDDMEIVGVTKTRPTFEARLAVDKGYDLYIAIPDNVPKFVEAGIPVKGTLDDLLKLADVVVDCTPGKKGADHLETYKNAGVKAIFQGGEKHENIGCSFNSLSNYTENLGVDFTRVVSCNTTGLARTIFPLVKEFGVKKVYATMVRRGPDPNNSKKGPVACGAFLATLSHDCERISLAFSNWPSRIASLANSSDHPTYSLCSRSAHTRSPSYSFGFSADDSEGSNAWRS